MAHSLQSVLAAESDLASNPVVEPCSAIDIFAAQHETEDCGYATPHEVKR